jgi:hypothetical protein
VTGTPSQCHSTAQTLEPEPVVDQLLDLRDVAVGAGDESEVEMLVDGVLLLEPQRRALDRGEQFGVVAVQILRGAEVRDLPGRVVSDDRLAADRIAQIGDRVSVHQTLSLRKNRERNAPDLELH